MIVKGDREGVIIIRWRWHLMLCMTRRSLLLQCIDRIGIGIDRTWVSCGCVVGSGCVVDSAASLAHTTCTHQCGNKGIQVFPHSRSRRVALANPVARALSHATVVPPPPARPEL